MRKLFHPVMTLVFSAAILISTGAADDSSTSRFSDGSPKEPFEAELDGAHTATKLMKMVAEDREWTQSQIVQPASRSDDDHSNDDLDDDLDDDFGDDADDDLDDEHVIGGSDQPVIIEFDVDLDDTTQLTYLFPRAVPPTLAGRTGKIFLLVSTEGDSPLDGYVFALPSPAYLEQCGCPGTLQVFSDPVAGLVPEFSELYFSQEVLSTQAQDVPFRLAGLSTFDDRMLVLSSIVYVESTGELELIQQVRLDVDDD